VLVEVGDEVPAGQSVPIEALLFEESTERAIGALGMVLLGSDT
jgi:hypothetical protein